MEFPIHFITCHDVNFVSFSISQYLLTLMDVLLPGKVKVGNGLFVVTDVGIEHRPIKIHLLKLKDVLPIVAMILDIL